MSNRNSNVDFNKLPYKLMLSENELPKQWYNVRADMKNKPAPLLNPATMKPITFDGMNHTYLSLGEKVDGGGAICHFGDSSFKVENSTFGVDGEKLFKTMKLKGEGVCRVVAEGARGKHSYVVDLSCGEKMLCPLLKGKTFSLTFELTKGCKINGVELAFACCK